MAFKEKGYFSHLPVFHLRIPRLTVNLGDGKRKQGNASLLTHRRHWLELNDKGNTEKQVLEHPTEPRKSHHSRDRGLKVPVQAVALAAFLSVELLTPGFQESKCDCSSGSLSEEGTWATAPALTSSEQLCPLLTAVMDLLINLVFWT